MYWPAILRSSSSLRLLAVLGAPCVAVALAIGLALPGRDESASANQPNAGLEFTLHVGACNTAGDTKDNCEIALGSTFVAAVSLDSIAGIGNGSYDALGVTLDYAGVGTKDNQDIVWPDCGFEAGASPPGFVNAGCAIGISAPSSSFTGTVFTASFNCIADGTVAIRHGAADTVIIDSKGKTSTETGPDVLNIDCVAPTATPTPSPTATPPPVPRVFKAPALQNVFLQRQGDKIPPVRCDDSTDAGVLTEQINVPITSFNQKGELQSLGAFEFEVRFNWTKVCVNLAPSAQWQALLDSGDAVCYVRDKDTSLLEGIAQLGCVSIGKGHQQALSGLELATISVRPQPEMYSQMRPNQHNGQAIQILNQGCELADEQGHAVPSFSCEDAAITFRYLEGDVDGPDCDVDVFDLQQVAFRWGVNKGNLHYKSFMDLEPSGFMNGDGDIDIKDLQFVYGRFGSTCDVPHPPQPPVNPKL